jgi:predicted nucleic acid-binding protein
VSVVLDSSAWIERWKRPELHRRIDDAIAQHAAADELLLVPATVVFETQRWLVRNVEQEHLVNGLAALVDQHELVPIDAHLARLAALTSVTTGLAHADATILAAARSRRAHLLTFDEDFAGIPDVTVLER